MDRKIYKLQNSKTHKRVKNEVCTSSYSSVVERCAYDAVALGSIPSRSTYSLNELTAISGVNLLDELVSLEGIGEKTAMNILEVFPKMS